MEQLKGEKLTIDLKVTIGPKLEVNIYRCKTQGRVIGSKLEIEL